VTKLGEELRDREIMPGELNSYQRRWEQLQARTTFTRIHNVRSASSLSGTPHRGLSGNLGRGFRQQVILGKVYAWLITFASKSAVKTSG
jgi:hypothetical protein